MLAANLSIYMIGLGLIEKDLSSYEDKSATNTKLADSFPQVKRYYIAKSSGECVGFSYKGKGMDFNNFRALEECENHKRKTGDELEETISKVVTSSETTPGSVPVSKCTGESVKKYYVKNTKNDNPPHTCEEFNYRGCGAGDNLFQTRKQCEEAISSMANNEKSKFDCFITPSVSFDQNNHIKVIADMENRQCVHAIVSDSATHGIFDSLKQCVDICLNYQTDKNPKCSAEISQPKCNKILVTKYFYNVVTKMCHPYLTEDCDHPKNLNIFDNLEECIGSCPALNDLPESDPGSFITVNDLCNAQSSEGHGNLDLIRFHYDHHTSKCKMFHFKGIGGNANNFLSKEECLAVCSGETIVVEKKPTSDIVIPEPVTEQEDGSVSVTADPPGNDTIENKELAKEGENEMSTELQ